MIPLGTDAPDRSGPSDLRLCVPAAAVWLVTLLLSGCSPGVAASVGLLLIAAVGSCVPALRRPAVEAPAALVAVTLLCSAGGALAVAGRLSAVGGSPVTALAAREGRAEFEAVVTLDPRPRTGGPPVRGGSYVVEARTTWVSVAGRRVSSRVPVVLLVSGPRWARLVPSQRVRAQARFLPADRGELVAALMAVHGPPRQVAPPSSAQEVAASARARLRAAASVLPEPERGLLPALVVGDVSQVPPTTRAHFEAAGMTHLLTVSGANLAVLTGAALALSRTLRLPRWCTVGASALMIAVFVLVARPEPSVLRAAFMGAIALVALALERERDGARALAAAVIGLVLFDPALARSPGFALSVLATGGIVVLAPRWRERWSDRLPAWSADALAVTLAAHVACLPLLAVVSAEVSWIAVPANLAVGPLVAVATVGGFLVAALALAAPPLAAVAVWLPGMAVAWINAVATAAARVPGGALPWRDDLYGALALAGVTVVLLSTRGRTRRLLSAAAATVAVTVLPLQCLAPAWPPAGWALVACDVGQGDALVLSAGTGRGIVVDAGADPAAVDRCLRDLRVREVPLLVLTHGDTDHVGGLDGVLDGRRVGTALVPPGFDNDAASDALAAASIPLTTVTSGRRFTEAGWTLEVLWPRSRDGGNAGSVGSNDASVVLLARLSPPGRSGTPLRALLTGDIEESAQRALLGDPAIRGVDVLKTPHHGARTQEPAFLTAAAPRLTLTSVGAGNPYGHPDPATWRLLTSLTPASYRTDLHGDIAVLPGPAVAHRTSSAQRRARPPRHPPPLRPDRRRTWHAACMTSAAVSPLTVVVGDEELLVDRAVAEIVAMARAEDPEVVVHDLLPSQVGPGKLAEVTSPSLFGERRVVILRSVHDLTKDLAGEVTGYLKDPADDVVLVLVHAGGAKGKALLEAAVKAGAARVTCAKPTKATERLQFVKGEFSRAGRQITADAAQALLDAVGNDLRELAAACTQLVADTEGRVDVKAVARYHTGRAEASGFTVADRAVEGRLSDALEQLRWSLSVGTAPVLINSALAGAVRGLAVVAQPPRGVNDAELAKRAKVPPWKLKTLRQQARGWTPQGVARALEVVAETDALIKGAGRDPAYALERAVIGIATARAQR
ncbi:DNA polymerase III, delta subunit [Marinactinospora thermotolerans DSM 45154]|uniref:DNA polymerase III, delta subunit n=2 Tax=Marinactinospora thermotolerans TaxID=531310 RepID=A0A1T4LM93_9ACTN|nr:DNA polymerase III, delta subunit [Marinactinospora thermotolerans DSM 45154]